MSNQTISFFKTRQTRGIVKAKLQAPVDHTDQEQTLEHLLGETLKALSENYLNGAKGSKLYLGFTNYKKNHTKEDIQQNTAIMLEYPASEMANLLASLNELPYSFYVIDTVGDYDDPQAKILLAFPLLDPTTSPRTYTRIASCLWDDINVGTKSQGSIAATFLFAPNLTTPHIFFHDTGTLLDGAAYLESKRGTWVNAREAATPTPKISDNGLFEGL